MDAAVQIPLGNSVGRRHKILNGISDAFCQRQPKPGRQKNDDQRDHRQCDDIIEFDGIFQKFDLSVMFGSIRDAAQFIGKPPRNHVDDGYPTDDFRCHGG